MKAIETVYRGYRFRSRLEARWAVFFDELGVEWRYEPEGFELPSGRYLPDFFIPMHRSWSLAQKYPGSGYWVEVKGKDPDEREVKLLCELTAATGHTSYLVIGPPGERNMIRADRSGAVMRNGVFDTSIPAPDGRFSPVGELWCAAFSDQGDRGVPVYDEIEAAMFAARQARFEHGQVGAPRHWGSVPA